jgi:hypothetical protein
MAGSRPVRLVRAALRCYPRRWRRRHGQEAAELASLLMRDGVAARSIAWSYFKGAASARLVLAPRGRLGAAVGALVAVACSLCVSLALVSAPAPAGADTGDIFGPGGLLHCSGLLGESVQQALPVLRGLHVSIAWETGTGTARRPPVPGGHYYVAGGTARSSRSIAIRVSASRPVNAHDQGC